MYFMEAKSIKDQEKQKEIRTEEKTALQGKEFFKFIIFNNTLHTNKM